MTQSLPPKFILEACMALCFDATGIHPDYLRQAKLNLGDENLITMLENCLLKICGNKITKDGDLKSILKLFNYPIVYDKSPLNILRCICWVAIKLQSWRDYSAKKMLLNYHSFQLSMGPFLEIQSICQHFVDNNHVVDKKNHIEENLTSNPYSFEYNLDSIVALYGAINHKLRVFKALDKRRVTLLENITALQQQQNLQAIISRISSPRLLFGLSTNIKSNNKSNKKSNQINYNNIDNLISNSNEFKIASDNAKTSQLSEISFWKWVTEGVITTHEENSYHIMNQLKSRPPSRPQLSASRLNRDKSSNNYSTTTCSETPFNQSDNYTDYNNLNENFHRKNIQQNMKYSHKKVSSLNTTMKEMMTMNPNDISSITTSIVTNNIIDSSLNPNIKTISKTMQPYDKVNAISPFNISNSFSSSLVNPILLPSLMATDIVGGVVDIEGSTTPPTISVAINDGNNMGSAKVEENEFEILKQEMTLSIDMISEVEEAVQTIYLSGGISQKLLYKISTVIDSELTSLGFDDILLNNCYHHHANSQFPKEDDSLHYKLLQQYWITPVTGVDNRLSELREKHSQLLNCALNACQPYSPYQAVPVRKSK